MMRLPILTMLCSALFLSIGAEAGQINWGSAITRPKFYSNGARLDEQMTFELGVFVPGFTPSAANTQQWAANWRRADVALYHTDSSRFSGTYVVESNAAPFGSGVKGYIWGHTGQQSGGEWVLLSAPGWTWPGTFALEQPVDWFVSGATQVTVGAANATEFELKTAQVSAPLPLLTWVEWRAGVFSAVQLANSGISGPQADPDADGQANLVEFALGSNPLVHAARGRVSYSLVSDGSRQRLAMSVTKRSDRQILWSAQASRDLSIWPAGGVTTVSESADVITFRESLSSSGDLRIFLRPVFTLP